MTSINLGWTPTMLRDVSMALSVSLARVPEQSLQETAIAKPWREAHKWVEAVQQLTAQADDTLQLDQVPPFPLTSQELRALQASIERIAQARAAASSTHEGATASHVRSSIGRVMSSAYGLGVVLAAGTVIVFIDLAFLQGARSLFDVGLCLGASILALAAWSVHVHHLGAHKAVINKAHPLP